eukprot:jgi/Botrbrau1/9071/Bobra.178_2s0003.1
MTHEAVRQGEAVHIQVSTYYNCPGMRMACVESVATRPWSRRTRVQIPQINGRKK